MVTYYRPVELIFKALGDSHRRLLLDRLFERDGQTLAELDAALPNMTRFGVMKHLNVLETANLVTVRRVGRHKLHYLNPVPIHLVLDRWIGKYAQPWIAMAGLKTTLEAHAMERPRHVYEVYIRTTPQALWHAITARETTRQYFGLDVESNWAAGSTYRYTRLDNGEPAHYGTILEVDPPRKLVHTFEHDYSEQHGGGPDDATRVTWEITEQGDLCKLTLIHDGWKSDSQSYRSAGQGWPMILSSLKSMVETGAALQFAEG
jgi:uncharacterized protein YndB with AHSA1/START domain